MPKVVEVATPTLDTRHRPNRIASALIDNTGCELRGRWLTQHTIDVSEHQS